MRPFPSTPAKAEWATLARREHADEQVKRRAGAASAARAGYRHFIFPWCRCAAYTCALCAARLFVSENSAPGFSGFRPLTADPAGSAEFLAQCLARPRRPVEQPDRGIAHRVTDHPHQLRSERALHSDGPGSACGSACRSENGGIQVASRLLQYMRIFVAQRTALGLRAVAVLWQISAGTYALVRLHPLPGAHAQLREINMGSEIFAQLLHPVRPAKG